MNAQPCAEEPHVDRHFAGSLSPVEEHAMREHVSTCPRCYERYERHLLLETLDPVALGPERRIARGLGLEASPARTVLRWTAPAVATLAMAAGLALLVSTRGASPTSGFTARGGNVERASDGSAGPAPAIFAYRAIDHGQPARAGAVLGRHDELAFAYENPSAKPYLMIFGVDGQRRVVWYHPAWSSEREEPTSIRIETTPGRHYLREAVAHDLGGRELAIHAVFSDAPLSVKTVERLVAGAKDAPFVGAGAGAGGAGAAELSALGGVESSLVFTLEP